MDAMLCGTDVSKVNSFKDLWAVDPGFTGRVEMRDQSAIRKQVYVATQTLTPGWGES